MSSQGSGPGLRTAFVGLGHGQRPNTGDKSEKQVAVGQNSVWGSDDFVADPIGPNEDPFFVQAKRTLPAFVGLL